MGSMSVEKVFSTLISGVDSAQENINTAFKNIDRTKDLPMQELLKLQMDVKAFELKVGLTSSMIKSISDKAEGIIQKI